MICCKPWSGLWEDGFIEHFTSYEVQIGQVYNKVKY